MKKNIYNDDSIFTVKSQKGYKAKNTLLDSGIELIAIHGVQGFTISDLCKHAGLKRTSFYSYFESVDDFVNQLSMREDKGFEAEFENIYGESYTAMKPGVKRLVCTLIQFYEIANTEILWNKCIMRLFTEHENTAQTMLNDLRMDVKQGFIDSDFRLKENELETYSQYIISSLSVTFKYTAFTEKPDNYGLILIKMILRSGNVSESNIEKVLTTLKKDRRLT